MIIREWYGRTSRVPGSDALDIHGCHPRVRRERSGEAVVEPAAVAALTDFDESVRHYEVLETVPIE